MENFTSNTDLTLSKDSGLPNTELQSRFLEALFGEAKGSPSQAKKIAGYSDTTSTISIVRTLRKEIQEMAELILAMNAPRAALAQVALLDDPTASGAQTTMKVAENILARTQPDRKDPSIVVPKGGLFIMPAKDVKEEDEVGTGKTIELSIEAED